MGTRLYANYCKSRVLTTFFERLQAKLSKTMGSCLRKLNCTSSSYAESDRTATPRLHTFVRPLLHDSPATILKTKKRRECYERLYQDFFYRQRSKEIIEDQNLHSDTVECSFQPGSSRSRSPGRVDTRLMVQRLSTDRRRSPYSVPVTSETLEVWNHCTFSPKIADDDGGFRSTKACEGTEEANGRRGNAVRRRLDFATPLSQRQADSSKKTKPY